MMPETVVSPAQAIAALKAAVSAAGSAKAWAASQGLSPQYVSEVLSGRREPSVRILAPLGLQRVTIIAPITKESRS